MQMVNHSGEQSGVAGLLATSSHTVPTEVLRRKLSLKVEWMQCNCLTKPNRGKREKRGGGTEWKLWAFNLEFESRGGDKIGGIKDIASIQACHPSYMLWKRSLKGEGNGAVAGGSRNQARLIEDGVVRGAVGVSHDGAHNKEMEDARTWLGLVEPGRAW